MRKFLSVFFWIYWFICFVFFFVLVTIAFIITYPFDRFHQVPNNIVRGLAWCLIKGNPGWKVTIKGEENYKRDKPTIFVSNHQSFLDMPLVYLLPWTMKWVSKKSLYNIPILGWIIYMTGHLGIDRKSLNSVKALDKLVEPVKAGIPAMFFPEGTRTLTGNIGRYKNGAFMLAKQYNFQIQPLVLEGGYKAMPSGSWYFNFKQHFKILILEPVNPKDFDSVDDLRYYVHNIQQQELELLSGELIKQNLHNENPP